MASQNILVIGGAGYIGSHLVRLIVREGGNPIVYDNLCDGHRDSVKGQTLVVGDLHERDKLEQTMVDHKIDSVVHFAAFAKVGESVVDPGMYYQNNVVGTCSLLEAMRKTNVSRIVFSSTCATYGEPNVVPITENESQEPINPYGFTKLVIERALRDYAHAYGFAYAALRYFNAAGASPEGDIGEDHDPETHLIPLVLQVALGQRSHITVFGDDYSTPDGTCIRDYIHVDDLGSAHLSALQKIKPGEGIEANLGTGVGNSVREVIDACRQVTGLEIVEEKGDRRAGDPPRLVADASLAGRLLDWHPQYTDITRIVETAWRWHQTHPKGYDD